MPKLSIAYVSLFLTLLLSTHLIWYNISHKINLIKNNLTLAQMIVFLVVLYVFLSLCPKLMSLSLSVFYLWAQTTFTLALHLWQDFEVLLLLLLLAQTTAYDWILSKILIEMPTVSDNFGQIIIWFWIGLTITSDDAYHLRALRASLLFKARIRAILQIQYSNWFIFLAPFYS